MRFSARRATARAIKQEALKLIDGLPEEASWDDVIYQMYVRKKLKKASRPLIKAWRSITMKSRDNSSRMKLIWTNPSVEDLRSIRNYIARDSEYYAIDR